MDQRNTISISKATVQAPDIKAIVQGDHQDPFAVLGCHLIADRQGGGVAVRAFLPNAVNVHLIELDGESSLGPMNKLDEAGFFEAHLPDRHDTFRYLFEVEFDNDEQHRLHDPYRFGVLIEDHHLEQFAQGSHLNIYEHLGAHERTIDGVRGVSFAVWAPEARRVSVIGVFNQWDGRRHVMRRRKTGVWEIFVPGMQKGDLYKFEIKTREGLLRVKSDPFGFFHEVRPANASVVWPVDDVEWHDHGWMAGRKDRDWLHEPVSIYEVHLGSWRRKLEDENRVLNYRELAKELADYVEEMGYTHVELMPITEYPYDPSWGYQVTGYYAVTSRHGKPEDFAYLVDYLHQRNIGVILDWVPAHFPKDDHALRRFDGSALFEHLDSRLGEHPDWGTLIFNLGRNEVSNFLLANACFWLEKFHIDGLRVDAVASMLYLDYSREEGQWLPNKHGGRENLEAVAFFKRFNEVVHDRYPGAITVAEESTAWPMVSRPTYLGGLGFTFKWNMGWMNDFLRYMREDPIHRKYHQNLVTFSLMYAFSENFILSISHDEVVHGKGSLLNKMPGDTWQKFANLRVALGYMFGHPGKKLLFMGSDIGQWVEWNHKTSLDWHLLSIEPHKQLQDFVKQLNELYRNEPALYEVDYSWEGFQWIDFQDYDNSLISFIRKGRNEKDLLIFVCNFTPVPRESYRIGVPYAGHYKEILNSDSEIFGGGNIGNRGGVEAEEIEQHNLPYSMEIAFPPLAVIVFKYQRPASASETKTIATNDSPDT